jgi:hypothetical protein
MSKTEYLLPNDEEEKLKLLAESSLYEFYKQALPVIDGSGYFSDEWFMRVIAEHLENVYYRKITKLLINVPPRLGKTSLISIAFPVWVWIHNPNEKFLCSSITSDLSLDIADKSRMLLMSDWFKSRWGDRFKLRADQNAKGYFVNDKNGYRYSTSVTSAVIGRGGNILICDDPNAVGGESEVIRDATNRWWSLKWFNRIILSDISPTCRVLVQQRGDELDVSGNIIANDINNEWVKLILPLEFEKDYVIPTSYLPDFVDDTLLPDYKSIWQDIRTEEGELLTERMTVTEVEQLKKELGSYDYAAIYQQRPAPLEGGIIKKHWFRIYKSRQLPRFEYIVQSWDTALTAKQNSAYSACTTWGIFRDAKDNTNVMLLSCWRDRLEYPELRERVKRLSVNYMDTSNVPIVYNPFYNPDMIVIEAKASGDPLIADLNRAGVYAEPFVPNQHGDKLQRVRLITPLIEGGMVWLPIDVENSIDIYEPAGFAKDFVNEVAYFPNPRSLDYVDTMTQALIVLRNLGKLMNPGDYIEPDDASIGRNVIY